MTSEKDRAGPSPQQMGPLPRPARTCIGLPATIGPSATPAGSASPTRPPDPRPDQLIRRVVAAIGHLAVERAEQRIRYVPHAGRFVVTVRRPRLVRAERLCPRLPFTPATAQLPVRARCTSRLMTALEAVIDSGRNVVEVAGGQHQPECATS